MKIISIIEECIDYSGITTKFSQFLEHKWPVVTFMGAKAAIKEYSIKNKITISKLMKSILIVYRNHGSIINNSQSFNTISEGDNLMAYKNKK